MELNEKDAPEGYQAEESDLCFGCNFFGNTKCNLAWNSGAACIPGRRADGKSVIFVPAKQVTSAPATLLHPMGSMGESI